MRKFVLPLLLLMVFPAWADVQFLPIIFDDTVHIGERADQTILELNAAPSREPKYGAGFRLMIDDAKYYIVPSMFMAKSKPDEMCHPIPKALTYKCEEGQPFVFGCHLLFFDAQGDWVGFKTLNIKEHEYPHFCNAMPALGIANNAKNELLVTMQYFLADGGGAKKTSDLGSDWFRMTTLFRVKANNGKIEVAQDDSCLGNPNQLGTIAKARKQLQRCATNLK